MGVTVENYLEREITQQKVLIQELLKDNDRIKSIGVQGLNLGKVSHIQIIACGSSYNAGLLGRHYLEAASNIPVSVVYGSEFIFSESVSHTKTLYIVISQSGETKDILDSIEILKKERCQIIGITNEKNSTLTRQIDICQFLNCEKEKSVAATKTFTMTCLYLYIFSLALGKNRGFINSKKIQEKIKDIDNLVESLDSILSDDKENTKIASMASKFKSIICLGNSTDYPIALECSLKLREISLLHVEGMPTGELKHGPIAMLDDQVLVIALVSKEKYYDRQIELFKKIIHSGAKLIIVSTINTPSIVGAEIVKMKETKEPFNPLLLNIFGQLLALNLGLSLNRSVDTPRNLSKVMSL